MTEVSNEQLMQAMKELARGQAEILNRLDVIESRMKTYNDRIYQLEQAVM